MIANATRPDPPCNHNEDGAAVTMAKRKSQSEKPFFWSRSKQCFLVVPWMAACATIFFSMSHFMPAYSQAQVKDYPGQTEPIHLHLHVPEISPLELFVPLPLPSEVPDSIPPNFRFQEQATNSTLPSIWFDALDTRGHRGYVADPTLLRRLVLQWHKEHPFANYWDRVQKYQSHLMKTPNISFVDACELVPGKSIFTQGGLSMLTERIKVDKTPIIREGCNEDGGADSESSNTTNKKELKLFCGVYTHDGKRDSARLAALSYGWKCDGFLAFSTATIPSLGMVALLHRGEEVYANMFQKSRSILSYVAMHYLNDYDYFHLAGDDMHMIVENFRSLMLEYDSEGYSDTKQGRIFGQYQRKRGGHLIFGGGPGYTLDRIGLKKLYDFMPKCSPNLISHSEDAEITHCVRKLNLEWSDNRDKCGRQRSHDQVPDVLYQLKPGPSRPASI